MKHPSKMKKPKFSKKVKDAAKDAAKRFPVPGLSETSPEDAGVPRITNETVAAHREEVLSSARKYIYPLQHSKHRVVRISVSIFLIALVVFLVGCTVALYKFQNSSTFLYEVTRVIPFPVAKAGPDYVSYESYLFELRHYIHYYKNEQHIDFTGDNKQQLVTFKQHALQQVIDDAYVKRLAKQNHVSVSDQDVNDEVSLVQSQNRLGTSDQMLADVLKQFWGWSIDDFKRELKDQLLAQKVVSTLDTGTHQRAEVAATSIKNGADFAKVATDTSDDLATKANGGNYGFAIGKTSRDVPPQVVAALFNLQPGQVSDIINTGNTLEIVKVISRDGDKVQAAHISFNFQPLSKYTTPLENKDHPKHFIHV